jgi:hypothetical protein
MGYGIFRLLLRSYTFCPAPIKSPFLDLFVASREFSTSRSAMPLNQSTHWLHVAVRALSSPCARLLVLHFCIVILYDTSPRIEWADSSRLLGCIACLLSCNRQLSVRAASCESCAASSASQEPTVSTSRDSRAMDQVAVMSAHICSLIID